MDQTDLKGLYPQPCHSWHYLGGGRINTPMHQTAITAYVVSSLVLHPGVGMGCVCGSFHALIPYGKSFFVGTSESKHQVIFVL